MQLSKSLVAEFIGTFWLVLGGCGSAVLAATFISNGAMIGEGTNFPLGIGLVGVSLAFGLTVVTMAYAIGHISGCHLNPAVSFGLMVAGRFPASQLAPYIIVQVLGAVAAAIILYIIASGDGSYGGLASNGYAAHSPGGYSMMSALVCEIVMTFIFLMVIIGATDRRAPAGFAPIAIGLCLTLIHLISIPVTNTSVNPARSTGPALIEMFTGIQNAAVSQLWLFWFAPIVGAVLAGAVYKSVFETAES